MPEPELRQLAEDYLKKLAKVWWELIKAADEAKSVFKDRREQCLAFFAGPVGKVWEDPFQKKFFGKVIPSDFQISINKAFELVALFGPVLYNRNPVRSVNPYDPIMLEPEAFGDPMLYQALVAQQQQEYAANRMRCDVLERYLNYTPQEQPEGGLRQAAEDGITEALVTGMGLLWPESYRMPGSDRTLTGCFYDTNENLVVDPDSRRMDFGKAKWVARRHVQPYWEVERRFNLPEGSLKKKAQHQSSEARASEETRQLKNRDRQRRYTFDAIEWWEVFSIGGIGGRLSGMDPNLRVRFDEVVGDYAYLAIASSVEWPLNCPSDVFETATVDEIRQRFQWPVPYWQDRRWPFAQLAFYRNPDEAWPISPLAPGLGELMLLNLIFSRMACQVYEGTRLFIALAESHKEELEKALRNSRKDIVTFGVHDKRLPIDKLVSFLQYPGIHLDLWKMASALMELFDKRVGLTELWYATSPTQSRTAADIQAKQEKAAIRPDHMAQKVEQWLSEVGAMEKLCAYWSGVRGQDVLPLVGTVGAQVWDGLFADADPEIIAREMQCEVVAGTAKKRNQQLELANIGQLYAPLSQMLTAYATATGDTRPLNTLNTKAFEAMNFDGQGLEMGPWMPPPPPPGSDPEELAAEAEEMRKQESHEAELERKDEAHDMAMAQGAQKLRLEAAKAALQKRLARIKGKAA